MILLGACASDGGSTVKSNNDQVESAVTQYNETAETEDRLICRREKRPGTNIAKKVCRTVRQMKEERKQAELFMDRSRPGAGQSTE
jgi:hypothetical protein